VANPSEIARAAFGKSASQIPNRATVSARFSRGGGFVQYLLGAYALNGVPRQLSGGARHPQFLGARSGNFPVVHRERAENVVSGIPNRLAPAGAQAVA